MEPQAIPIHTTYGFATGVELKAIVREAKDKSRQTGALVMRFFGFKEKYAGKSERFVLNSVECFAIAEDIEALRTGPIKASFKVVHKFGEKGKEIISSVVFECYEKKGPKGAERAYSITLSRNGQNLPVGIRHSELGFLAAFLKQQAVAQAWQKYLGKEGKQPDGPPDQEEYGSTEVNGEQIRSDGLNEDLFPEPAGAPAAAPPQRQAAPPAGQQRSAPPPTGQQRQAPPAGQQRAPQPAPAGTARTTTGAVPADSPHFNRFAQPPVEPAAAPAAPAAAPTGAAPRPAAGPTQRQPTPPAPPLFAAAVGAEEEYPE